MAERLFEIPLTIEQRREMFVGKSALAVAPLLISSIPEIRIVDILAYQRGLYDDGEEYPPIASQMAKGAAVSFFPERGQAVTSDYWIKMAEEVKEIVIPDILQMSAEQESRRFKEGDKADREVHLSLSSRVFGQGPIPEVQGHIPLMDFRCVPTAGRLSSIKSSLIASGENSGIILHSGKSYHYYGLRTLTPGGWHTWMEMWLRNTWIWPFADRAFIKKSLADGYNFLRLTRGASKPIVPVVVAVI